MYNYGTADFENYWGEELLVAMLFFHYDFRMETSKEVMLKNIPNKTKHVNALITIYDFDFLKNCYWGVIIKSKSGQVYGTKGDFYCNITKKDNDKVILGVNGDSKSLYVTFSESSSCNKKLDLLPDIFPMTNNIC